MDALACGNKFPIFFLGIGHVFAEGFKLGFFVFEQLSDEVFGEAKFFKADGKH